MHAHTRAQNDLLFLRTGVSKPLPLCFRVMKVASQYKTGGLTFSVANKKDFLSELEDDFGLGTSDGGELPFVTIRTKLGHKFTMREEFTYVATLTVPDDL